MIIEKGNYTFREILNLFFVDYGLEDLREIFKNWINEIIKDRLKLNEDLRYLNIK